MSKSLKIQNEIPPRVFSEVSVSVVATLIPVPVLYVAVVYCVYYVVYCNLHSVCHR